MMPTKRYFFALLCVSVFIARSSCSLSVGSLAFQRRRQSSLLAVLRGGGDDSPIPIVYTIAGSDSGGGAGIQADLHAIHAFGCHGCSVITCLTAQNSQGVRGVHSPPAHFLQTQLDALLEDLPPTAIKIGMLGDGGIAATVARFLKEIRSNNNHRKVWVVLDPVMISTSGHKLISEETVRATIKEVFPQVDVVTPNKFEAEALLGRKLLTPEDVEQGARDILDMGCKAVLIKGGHTLIERNQGEPDADAAGVESTLRFAQDYFLSSPDPDRPIAPEDERFCDGSRGVWLRTPRWDTDDTHGTGCTLSSALASALALGEHQRQNAQHADPEGATHCMDLVDACCLAKAYVSAGIQQSVQLGSGPGPVAHTVFPRSSADFPTIVDDPRDDTAPFPALRSYNGVEAGDDDDTPVLGRILPIVDTTEWVEKLSAIPGVRDIQLRIKNEKDPSKILDIVKSSQEVCSKTGVRLWINDHWRAALEAGCFGVHVGQEDLAGMLEQGGLELLKSNNVALGISTHSYGELAAAIGIQPSYISMGPVFATSSKKVKFEPQGLGIVHKFRKLIPNNIPFMTIGGIGTVQDARRNRQAGANSVAVIGAITNSDDIPATVDALNEAMI